MNRVPTITINMMTEAEDGEEAPQVGKLPESPIHKMQRTIVDFRAQDASQYNFG